MSRKRVKNKIIKDMYNSVSQAKIAVSKSLLKEYKEYTQQGGSSRVVYMDNGTEFQIQLFNPKTTEIACRVYINDEAMSNDIVLRPGERLWLERFLDRPQKFLFETYTVDGSDSEVQRAIRDNGTIRVRFFDRHVRQKQDGLILEKGSNFNYSKTYNTFDTSTATSIATNTKTCSGEITCSSAIISPSSMLDLQDSVGDINTASYYNALIPDTKQETGRITEGSYSQQSFDMVNMNFESWSYSEEVIKILPTSQKPIHKEDLQKRYCPECGRRVVEKYKFCPFCGTKL